MNRNDFEEIALSIFENKNIQDHPEVDPLVHQSQNATVVVPGLATAVPDLVHHRVHHHRLVTDDHRIEMEVIVDVTGAVVDARPEAAHVGVEVFDPMHRH